MIQVTSTLRMHHDTWSKFLLNRPTTLIFPFSIGSASASTAGLNVVSDAESTRDELIGRCESNILDSTSSVRAGVVTNSLPLKIESARLSLTSLQPSVGWCNVDCSAPNRT